MQIIQIAHRSCGGKVYILSYHNNNKYYQGKRSDQTSGQTTVQFCHGEHKSQRQYTHIYIHMSRNRQCVGNTGEEWLSIHIPPIWLKKKILLTKISPQVCSL